MYDQSGLMELLLKLGLFDVGFADLINPHLFFFQFLLVESDGAP